MVCVQMRHVGQACSGEGLEALPKFPRSAGEPWATVYEGPQQVIFGHHARRRLQVLFALLPCSACMLCTSVLHMPATLFLFPTVHAVPCMHLRAMPSEPPAMLICGLCACRHANTRPALTQAAFWEASSQQQCYHRFRSCIRGAFHPHQTRL